MVKITLFDFHSAFNMIQPLLLRKRLQEMSVNAHIQQLMNY